MKFKVLAEEVLTNVGGKENVKNVYHCATRLRFTLIDKNKADQMALKKVDGVITVVDSGGMLQVVIGNTVKEVFEELSKLVDLSHENQESSEGKEKKNILNAFIDTISGVFAPTLGLLAASGLIRGLLALLVNINILSPDSGTYLILNTTADAFFLFMPIFLAYTAALKFKTDVFASMAVAAALVHPDLIRAFTEGMNVDFLGIPVVLARYTSSVIPAILAVWVLSYVEKFFRKRLHESVRSLLTPFFTIIIMVPLTLLVVGPVATFISNSIANMYLNIFDFSAVLSGAIMGGSWQVLVMFGLHWGFVPVMTNNIAHFGVDTLGPFLMVAVASQAGAALGVFFKAKNTKVKSLSFSAFISAIFGITEPAVYGITLKYKKPFYIASGVSAIFAGFVATSGSAAMAVAPRSILTLPVYMGEGFVALLASYFLAMIVTGVLTYLFGYTEMVIVESSQHITQEKLTKPKKEFDISSPANGDIIDLHNVKDETFSSGALGNGFGVVPSDNIVKSPVEGKITAVFPTKHAVGITTVEGAEVLVHIGVDTVELGGKHFELLVEAGTYVKMGESIVKFDLAKVKNDGYDPTIIVVVTNSNEFPKFNLLKNI